MVVGVADTVMLDGQDIGQAQRATSAILAIVLAEHGTTGEEWAMLNALGTSSPERARFVAALAGVLATRPAAVEAAIDDAEAAGVVRMISPQGPDPGAVRVELTAVGHALHGLLREAIDHMARELYSGIPEADLAATRRVLAEVTVRADGWAALWEALPGQEPRRPASKSAR
jgi:DNA-binding MarR family transcriptional regulator